MENFEKCTVAMLGGPCSQHVTGNTPWQNQPQSAINIYIYIYIYIYTIAFALSPFRFYVYSQNLSGWEKVAIELQLHVFMAT